MIRYIKLSVVFILLTGLIFLMMPQSYSQEQNQEPGVDQKKIDEAVAKGVKFLLKNGIKGRETELMVLTLLHAGVEPRQSQLRGGIAKVKSSQLRNTYRVAFTAMALEKADPYKYQSRIAECAQALVNYQCKNGQWHYDCRYNMAFGKPKKTREIAALQQTVVTGQESKPKKPLKKIIVSRRNKNRSASGCNSNTQFALLGLHAAARCGIEIPKETWQDAANWLTSCQLGDGGWCYCGDWEIKAGIKRSYGGMTCACLCGLAIAKFYLNPNQNLLEDAFIKRGLNWLANRLTFAQNPGPVTISGGGNDCYLYYYIYGVERVGTILKIREMGSHQWYQEGVKYLLAQQAKDGSWDYAPDHTWSPKIVDTCFAILFLKKATPALPKAVISGQ